MNRILHLPLLDTAQLRELIERLPDPQASAQEMVGRGWITPDQFSALFPDAMQRPNARKTMLIGFAADDSPPDADCDWSLPLSVEEDQPNVPPEVATERGVRPHFLGPVLFGAASAPQLPSEVRVPPVACENEARRREKGTEKLPRRRRGWAGKGLLISTLISVTFFAGLQLFGTNSTDPPVADQESRQANAGDPAREDNPVDNAKQPNALLNDNGPNAQPAAPQAVPPAAPVAADAPDAARTPAPTIEAKPKAKAPLYARIRQVVLEHKTDETQRLGIGDVAYQDVPENGSIMVGMEVTYKPFFNHNVIKSVRPIYQGPDGKRYDGSICGNPTQDSERVVAKDGYAIGAATIQSGMGIDAMQLTFMEIGADGLNTNKSYLSKWLGGYGGADAKTYLNDGRPVIGIVGMWSKNNYGPAFCMGLVTTRAGALAAADGLRYQLAPSPTPNNIGPNVQRVAPEAGPAAAPPALPQ